MTIMPSNKSSANKSKAEAQRKKPPSQHQQAVDLRGSQKSISDLFSTSKQGLDRSADEAPLSSPNKRLKRDHIPSAALASPQSRTIYADQMYNFTSSKAKTTSEVIDLTTSPNGSPIKKGINAASRPTNLALHQGPRRLVVKNLKNIPRQNPDEYYNRVWVQLDAALSAIFKDDQLPYSMEELYKGVEFSCRQDRAPDLFEKLQRRCIQTMETQTMEFSVHATKLGSDIDVLRNVVSIWLRWNRQFDMTRSIFFYLDRSYLIHAAHLPTLQELGTNLFRDHIFSNSTLRPKILQGACDLVAAERRTTLSADDGNLLCKAIDMFHALAVYTKYFEPKLLSDSEKYFASWAKQAVSSNDLAGFVQMCDRMIEQESARSEKFGLEQTTGKVLETYLEEILIEQQQDRLAVEKDLEDLLVANDVAVLQQLFSLLQRRYLGEKLRQPFEAYINKHGSEIVFDEKREQEMVTRLLDFKRKLDNILDKAFRRHEGLGHSLREAFECFINKSKRTNMTWGTDNPKPGEMIAKHVDAILKGGTKAVRSSSGATGDVVKPGEDDQGETSADEDAEISRSLDQVLDLFRFVHGKAVFEAFYKRDLARRLLLGRSASADAEKSMLSRLKSECGAGFTHNLEHMFKDIEMARDEIASYKTMIEERGKKPLFDLSVNVLSSSAWPSYPNVTVNMPETILKAVTDFEHQYKQKHVGRKLEWKHALAHCQLKSVFPKGNKEIVVSSFQAIVLLAFNGSDNLSYTELQALTGLDNTELKRTLQSLACARYRVLRKNPLGKDVNNSDTFSVNAAFTHPKYRIKINQIQAKETKAENQATHERVAADRQFETQAAIVRIMKGRKTITHAELVSEVIVATKSRGVLDPADIKKNIEKLIEKDYMERDEDEKNVYNYVA